MGDCDKFTIVIVKFVQGLEAKNARTPSLGIFRTDHGIVIPGLDKTTVPPASKGADKPRIRSHEAIEVGTMGSVIV